MMEDLNYCIGQIIEYTKQNPRLGCAHHFLFNLPLPDSNPNCIKFVVMGINPGEHPRDWELVNEPMQQETHLSDFHEEHGTGRMRVPWTKTIIEMCGTKDVVQSEAFFWSSRSTRSEHFRDRFGFSLEDQECAQHLKFCAELNKICLDFHKPTAVVFPGLGQFRHLQPLYGLRSTCTRRCPDTGHRLVEYATDLSGLPWLFTKHWSGARGFTTAQRAIIQELIAEISAP